MGLSCPPESYMTLRERCYFVTLVFLFSSIFAASVIRFDFPPQSSVPHPHYQFQRVSHSQFAVAGMCEIVRAAASSNQSCPIHLVSLRLFKYHFRFYWRSNALVGCYDGHCHNASFRSLYNPSLWNPKDFGPIHCTILAISYLGR